MFCILWYNIYIEKFFGGCDMMNTITVKGIGNVSVKPDWIIVSMKLETENKEYDKTTELAAERITLINESLAKIGFESNSVKTTDFNVRTNYESVKDKNGNYKSVFKGYVCNHRLKVEFDFDTKRLAQVLSAISECLAKPEFSISFTVKDSSAVSGELLQSAARNAKEKAEILCSASGVKLGDLISIDYDWGEISLYSDTNYEVGDCLMAKSECLSNIDIHPDDIKTSDTATFVWEIL